MPNPKMGTVTKDVGKAVKTAKAGAVQFKTDKRGIIQGAVGKVSFSKEALLENVRSFMVALMDAKPEGFKGKYLKSVNLSTTMGPGVTVDLSSVDPSNPKFMLDLPVAQPKVAKQINNIPVQILVWFEAIDRNVHEFDNVCNQRV